jgi:hypothetical protein
MRVALCASIPALAAVLLAQPVQASSPPDSCLALIPAPVQEALAKQLPAYRLPVQSDNLAEDVAYNREHGGSGCLGLAIGDFHGRNNRDYALLLTSRSADETVLVVATLARGSWRVERLRNWGEGRARFYVEATPKGTHVQSEALDADPSEPGGLSKYTSSLPCVVSGVTESSGVAYCYTGKRWVHVWGSD